MIGEEELVEIIGRDWFLNDKLKIHVPWMLVFPEGAEFTALEDVTSSRERVAKGKAQFVSRPLPFHSTHY